MAKTNKKSVAVFDAGAIEFQVSSSIKKNTLPAIRESWINWLEGFKAENLETDKDFVDAAKFISECKRVEDTLGEIRENAVKGEVAKAIEELEAMREKTRLKRLEFNRVVEARKGTIRSEAVAAAVKKVRSDISGFKYKSDALDIEAEMRTAIKGKSAILKMNEELNLACARLLADAKAYSERLEAVRKDVAALYEAAGETSTDSELDLLVNGYKDGAPERAKVILEQKRLARDQAELNRQREALAAEKAPAAAPEAPAAAPARSALSAAEIPDKPKQAVRFGATFLTSDIEATKSIIESVGGTDVKFVIR